MTTTVASGLTTLTPILVDGYSSERASRNIIHPVIGTEWPAVTLRPAHPRTGTLSMLCANQIDALAMEALHAAAEVLTLADTDVPGINMTYVSNGSLIVELDEDSRLLWWVRVDFQEVQP